MTERRPMDPVDEILLRQERDPRRRSTITLVVHLDRMPDWDQFIARLSNTVHREARLRQRVVRPHRNLGAPEWVVEREIDVRHHLDRHTLRAPGTTETLVAFLERTAGEGLNQDRPLWRITLLDGLADGGAALVARMSHVLTDGLSGMQLLAGMVDIGGKPVELPEPTAAADANRVVPPLTRERLTIERVLTGPVKAQRRYWLNYAIGVRTTAAVVANPRRRVGAASRYALSLARMAKRPASEPSFSGRSSQRRFTCVDVPADALRRAGRCAGGSLNDAYLAAVLGGLRRYHEKNGTQVDLVPFAIPVSTRQQGEKASDVDAGNRFAGVRFAAPVSVVDPSERIRMVSDIVRKARAEPALDAMTTLAPALVQLPDRVLGLAGRAQDRLDMQASYVPGPPVTVGLAGTEVTSMWALGPLPGPAVMSVLLTYAGVARVGFTIDARAVTDVDAFRQAMVDGFSEVLELDSVMHERT